MCQLYPSFGEVPDGLIGAGAQTILLATYVQAVEWVAVCRGDGSDGLLSCPDIIKSDMRLKSVMA